MKKTFNISCFLVTFALFVTMPAAYALADGPTITGATDITSEAASSTGAIVTFNNVNATTTNASSTSFTFSCTPPSGSLFALATTTITCVADDGIATTTATFSVSVVDRTPPSITPPADQTFTAAGTSTTPRLIEATSTDLVDPNPTISYSPTSFSVGTTTVTWTATDSFNNTSTTTSIVTITEAVPVYLEVEADTGTVFPKQLVNVGACLDTQNGTTTTINALCAFNAAGLSTGLTWFSFGAQVDSINGVVAPGYPGNTWIFFFNNDLSNFGATDVLLNASDSILWTLGIQPLKISASSTSPVVGATTTINVRGFDTNAFDFEPVAGATLSGVTASTTDANGNVDILITSTSSLTISATASGFLSSQSITITPHEPQATPPPVVPSVGGGGVIHHTVDVNKAMQFLLSKELPDGSFGPFTDWVAIALASNGNPTDKVAVYLKSANSGMSVATDYERHAMALIALGINPYTDTPINYIQKIVDTFDGTQIGDPGLINDDIFSLIPLGKAGYANDDPMIQKIVSFILKKQLNNGSWEGGVDMTAAGIQALSLNPGISGVSQAITNARAYLYAHQNQNGGFGNSYSTSWVLQAISTLHESELNWIKNNNTPKDYLYALQTNDDGGIEPASTDLNSRIWATAYAIPAALGKPWASILSSFIRPTAAEPAGSNGVGLAENTVNTTTATSSTSLSSMQGNSTTTGTSTISVASSTKLAALTATTTIQASSASLSALTNENRRENSLNNSVSRPKLRPVVAVRTIKIEASSTAASSSDNLLTASASVRTRSLATVESSAVIEGLKNIGTAIIHSVSSFVGSIISFFWRW